MIKTRDRIDVKTNNLNVSIVINNSPVSFRNRFKSDEIDFKDIIWIYWDWDDWCQYWEVLPSDEDVTYLKSFKSDLSDNEWRDFLKKLIS